MHDANVNTTSSQTQVATAVALRSCFWQKSTAFTSPHPSLSDSGWLNTTLVLQTSMQIYRVYCFKHTCPRQTIHGKKNFKLNK